jgi:NAD dependent epimerase/dehydratase family enzyme
MPWIHITDLCGIYLKAIEDDEMKGSYNSIAPEHITNKDFLKAMCNELKRPVFFLNLPTTLLKFVFGEMSVIFLNGSKVSSEKIVKSGYQFKFPTIKEALAKLF